MNKHVYLGLSVLESSKILIHEFSYDYKKQKYGEKVKMCSMDTDSFIVYIKTDNIYKDIAEDVETRFDTSNYQLDIPFTKRKKIKSNWINERWGKTGGKVMTKFVGSRVKTYSYLIDYGSEDKKAKGTKMCVINRKLKFEN